jgi:small subunit ribosomal protein S16
MCLLIYTQHIRADRAHVGDCSNLLKIRLRRTGAKKQPSYRLVVAESTAPRDGTFLENLGHYNPLTTPTTFEIKEERIRAWLQRGAQPTERVARLLSARGILPPQPSSASQTPSATPAA